MNADRVEEAVGVTRFYSDMDFDGFSAGWSCAIGKGIRIGGVFFTKVC